MNTGRYGRRGVLWVALALLGLCLAGHALHYDYVVDDAFISFRYAQNFLQGHGLVYNPGERVEGYTNFLWVLLVALGMVAGADPAPFSQALGFAAAAATLCVVFLRPVALSRSPAYVRLLAPALLCLSPPFALWSVGGLETSLFTFFVFSGLSAGARRESGASGAVWDTVSGLSLALACLTRPEGFLAFLLVVGNRVLWPATPGGRFPIRLVMAWAVVVVPYELWRWSYYGFLFPNSYYAKVGWGGAQALRGLRYLGGFAAGFGGAAVLLAFLGLAERPLDGWARTLYLWSALYTAYVVTVGGDGLFMYRFLVPVLPALYLLSARGLLVLGHWLGRVAPVGRKVAVAAACVVLGVWTLLPTFVSAEKASVERDRIFVEKHWIPIGKWLSSYAEPGESIAVTTAGAVPYYSGLYTIDMLGINEAEIAHRKVAGMGTGIAGHEKHDMEYVVGRRPTYMFHHLFLLTRPKFTREQFETPWNPGEEELLTSEVFAALYEPVSEKVGPFYINFFRLREMPGE